MAEGDACLLDSNILLRISKSDDPEQPVIVQALKTLVGQGCASVTLRKRSPNSGTPPRDRSIKTALA